MKKRGFTLVELLAVIIVLSVIALIATPMVLGTIEDSKRGSFEQGIKNIVKVARTYQAREEVDNPIVECRYFSFDNDVKEITVRDGKTYYPLKELSLKGTLPTKGEVKVCSEEITVEASDGSYSGKYDDGQTNIGKGDLADNDLSTPIIDLFNVSTTTDKIMVAISAHSPSVGGEIVNYYYKIDNGDYIKTSTPSYTFEKLTAGKEYVISVKVENKSGITNEASKTVATKKFGELTIQVTDMGKWTSSKKVTIKSSTEGSTIEYNVIRYNEETSQDEENGYIEYTNPFTLSTLATGDHPTIVVARYNDGGVYSEEKTYVITKIDPTAPTTTMPSVVVSSTKPTSEANVTIRQADSESGLNQSTIEYGYSASQNGTYTWQTSSKLTKLTAGKTYYVKTRVTNNAGLKSESAVQSYQVGAISTCSVNILTSGWATSKDIKIVGSQTGAELQYQIGTTDADKWINIENNGTLNITENTTVYCRLWDGTTENVGQGIINKIDKTSPELTLGAVTTTTNSASVSFAAVDNESQIKTTTCKYSSTNGSYTTAGTISGNVCNLNGLSTGKTYYYQICTTNNAGNPSVCKTGSTNPVAMTKPGIGFTNTPSTIQNGYLKQQIATVSYVATGITSPRYFVKTSRAATSSVAVTKSCGADTNPAASCTTITSTTSLAANTWYEVSGNVNVTYSVASDSNATIYATTYDGTNFSGNSSGTVAKIDRTSPELTLGALTVSTNSATINFTATDSQSGISSTTCKYSSTNGSYTTAGTISGNTCKLNNLVTGTTYYYQICVTDKVSNTSTCKTGSTNPATMTKPSIGFTNTPSTIQNGYLKQQVANVTYVATGITSPRYFVKTSRAATSSVAVTKSCGSDTNPAASCTTITSTTSLAANTWYEVLGNVNVTYSVASDSNATIYATTYDGTNFSGNITGTVAKIDRTNPTVTLGTVTTTTNSSTINFGATDSQSGIGSTSCKYSSTNGSYTTSGTISGNTCKLNGLTSGTTYYYQICSTDKVGNGATCKTGSTDSTVLTKPSIGFTNTPSTIQNGYLRQQVANVKYVATGITSPRYFVKTSRAATSSVAVTKSCGADTNPAASCTTITSTTSLAANTWYEVSGNVNVTYSVASDSNATIYATTYDGTNFSGNITGTVAKIDRTSPTVTLGTATTTTNSVVIPFSAADSQSGISSTTCKYSSTSGSYTTTGTISGNTCKLTGLTSGTTYYYQICSTDKVGNSATCKTGSTSSTVMEKPSITATNTPSTPVNGYVKQQVDQVKYVATGIASPRYFVKTTRAATSSVAVTKSCGTGTTPTTSCTTITSTTSLAADTWYEVSGNLNVTYNKSASTTAVLYATTYDGTNFSGNISSTIPKVDPNGPTTPTVTLKLNSASGSPYTSGSWTNQNVYHIVNSTDSESGIAYYQYSHNGSTGWSNDIGTLSGWSSSYNSDRSQLGYLINWGGSWDFYVRAVDYVGNVSANSAKFTVKIDKTAPSLSGLSNASGGNWSNKAFNVTINVSESGSGIAKCQYKYAYDQYSTCNNIWCDDNSGTVSNGVYTGTFSADRNTTSYFRCFDSVGNVSNELSTPIKIDTTGPTSNAPTVAQSSSNARSLVVTNNQTDSGSGLNSGTLSYGYSTSSNGTYTWQSSNTFGSLTAGTTYYFKTKVKNNAGVETVSSATAGKIAYTGIAAGTYSAGASITYAGTTWQVIKDNGNNVTLISKNNIGTGMYSSGSSTWSSSNARTAVINWFNSNTALKADWNVTAIIADSSTGDYVRIPRSSELSTSIPNGSGSPFWTMSTTTVRNDSGKSTSTHTEMILGSSNGSSSYTTYLYKANSAETLYKYIVGNNNSTSVTIYPSYAVTSNNVLSSLPSWSSVSSIGSIKSVSAVGGSYLSRSTSKAPSSSYYNVCDSVKGVTSGWVSTGGTYGKSDSCSKYSDSEIVYKVMGPIGYRAVITVREK